MKATVPARALLGQRMRRMFCNLPNKSMLRRFSGSAVAMRMTRYRLVGFVLFASAVAVSGALGQTTGSQNPPLVIRSVAGRDLFEFYCATCHGRDAKGNGPAASSLKVAPPDLTLIARRNGGAFPRSRVEAFIAKGSEVETEAHGVTDMPVWGPVFRGLDPSDILVKVRLENLVQYLESVQAK